MIFAPIMTAAGGRATGFFSSPPIVGKSCGIIQFFTK
jgi:hypothetical protein